MKPFSKLSRHVSDSAPLFRIILVWALVLAVGAFVLDWLQYQYFVRMFSPQIYIAIIGTAFAAGGVWVGWRLSARPAAAAFVRNDAALTTLGLTGQEMKVLERLAAGQSNKEIAAGMGLSPNTVKTHAANLFAKLEAGRRSQAVAKARLLRLIP
ncbi:MAG TPA: LuxR C-terminal-related transcriptional regulator [Rhizomicrobium sp.]|nr:LuxR C-terminal-related transcriptional regulator [Rhizomicrobium sp.]